MCRTTGGGVSLRNVDRIQVSTKPGSREKNYIDDISLFSSLGFDTVDSVDISDYEGANLLLDLNDPVPYNMHGKYDIILDGGTIEHIFHLPNVLNNIHNMLKVGGRVIHFTPSASVFCIDYGFYMFSPTLFNDYYQSNGYRIETCYISHFDMKKAEKGLRDIYQYDPEKPEYFRTSRRDSFEIIFVATKTKESTGHIIPRQGSYLKGGSKNTSNDPVDANTASNTQSIPHNILANLYAKLENRGFFKNKLIRKLVCVILDCRAKKRLKPLFRY